MKKLTQRQRDEVASHAKRGRHLSQKRKDATAIRAAILRLFLLHQGGNDPNLQYAQQTKLIVRRANGAYKRLFGRSTGATCRSRS